MANRQTLKDLIVSTIYDNLLRKITAPKHQELELQIMDSVVTKEDDIVNDFSSEASDKVASAGTVKTLNNTTLKLGRVQTTTAWLNQSTIPEGDYDVTFENAGQNLFGYTHFKVSIRYLNLGTEYIQLLESVDGRKFRRSNVLNVYGDFEEVTVGEGSGITSVVAGENVEIDYTDPKNPRINFPGGIGTDGVGIVSIAKTGTVGLVDTYTITYTDETTSTYTVTNGSSGTNGLGITSITRTSGNGVAGTTDTYTITFTDDSTTTFNVVNGEDGRGIVSRVLTSSVGLVDTYTTTYTDGSTDTYTVTNGSGSGIDPEKLIEINRVIENDTAPILIVKDEVDAVENLSSSYPNAEFGWASRVKENGFIYSFNGVEWKNTGRKLFESELNAIVGSSNSNINYNLIIAKKMFGLGDSFMEGEFFAELVAKNLKCLLVKDGIGGSCITGGMENAEGDGTTRISIVNRIDAVLSNNYDILLVQGGSNDWYYQSTLGTIDSTDINTYYGALKYIASKCASRLQKIVVVPINLMVRNTPKKNGGSAGRTNYSNQRQYADAFVEVFKMYGIQTCDIFSNLSITFENSSFYTIDGCHPNLAGKVRLSNYISQWIISNASVGLNQSQVITGEYVNWINLYKFTFANNVLSSVSGGWMSSARGDQSFVSKSVFSGIQAKLNMPTQVTMDGIFVGFSDIEPSSVAFPRYNAIRYALYWTGSYCAVWENGIQQGDSTSLAGGDNSFAIQLRNGNVEYIINSVTVRTVPVVDGLVLFPVATSTNNPTIVNCDLTIN